MENQVCSPTSTDASLEYITVDAYAWPKSPRTQRRRLDEQERKRRHREGQRQFMLRKRSRILELRNKLKIVETQLNYLWALNEEKLLREDRERLDRIKAEHGIRVSDHLAHPLSPSITLVDSALDSILSELLMSL